MTDRVGHQRLCEGLNVLVLSPTPTHPQDFGNRKRIFQVCQRFSDEGARITFVHYPAELEWRGKVPASAERAMKECWDHYYTIGPTRPLHTDARGSHHRIDDWWDDAIGGFLRWIFSVQQIDVFIVNYSWLSKALEYAPRGTLRILDTHDKVSGRRDMLTSLRLHPEFFYTDDKQETIALNRADLVWAIKDEERALFEQMSPTPVLTMPHLDPLRPMDRPEPDEDGFLRVGIIGARNNVNRMNIAGFLEVAVPLFEAFFAPIKLIIGGTVCDLLDEIDSPFVELRGPVKEVEEFYGWVDCAIVPMRASTGLKIKAGEALSLGMPLLSLAHAFEGYEASDARQILPDFAALANALIDLSFAPRSDLDVLADASKASHARTAAKIDATFRETLDRACTAPASILLAVDSRAFVPGSIFNLALESVFDNLRWLGVVRIVVVSGSVDDVVEHRRTNEHFDRIFIADDLAGAGGMGEALRDIGVFPVDLEGHLGRTRPMLLVIDALHPALESAVLPETIVLTRTEMIALWQGRPAERILGKGAKSAVAVAPDVSRELVTLAAAAGARTVAMSCFCRASLARIRAPKEGLGRRTLAVLGDPGSPAVDLAVNMARAWGMEPFVVYGFGGDNSQDWVADRAVPSFKVDAYLDALFSLRAARPHFAIDLSLGRPGLGLCREVIERLRVPLISGSAKIAHPSLSEGAPRFHAGTERELWNAMRSFASDSDATRLKQFEAGWNEVNSGSGWHWLHRHSYELFGPRRKVAA